MAFPKEGTMSRRTKSNNSIMSSDHSGAQSSNISPPPRQRQQTASRSRVQYQEVIIEKTATRSHYFENEEGEDEDRPDSLGFMPVREARGKKRAATRGEQGGRVVGRPITGDPELAGMSPYRLEVLQRFMDDAKKLRVKVMSQKRWDRIESVFTDKMLRTIGLRLPTCKSYFSHLKETVTNIIEIAENELTVISGITPEKVQQFGRKFLDLAKRYKQELEMNMEGADMSQVPASEYFSQAPIDVGDDDENYIDSDDDEDYGDETGERSEYFASGGASFQPPGMSQAQLALLGQVAGAARTGGGSSSSKAASGGRVKKAYSGGRGAGAKRAPKKGASGARRQSGGGKRFSTGSATSQGASRSARPSGGGGGRGARGGGGRSQGAGSSFIRPMA